MLNKKIGAWIIAVLIILQFPLILFLANFKGVAFDIDFYKKEFDNYNPAVENAIPITDNLIYYLRYKEVDAEYIKVFEKDEIEHLIDVKGLIQRCLLVLNLSMVLIGVFILGLFLIDKVNFLRNLSLSILFGGFFTWIVTFITHLMIKDFDKAFVRFHELFFKLGTWDFPSTYKLVILFPKEFWIDIVNKIIGNVVISANILIVVGFLILFIAYKTRRR